MDGENNGKPYFLMDDLVVSLFLETPILITLQEINISHLGKRKIIFKMDFSGDMLVPRKVLVLVGGRFQPLWNIFYSQIGSWNPKDSGENYKTYLKLTTT